MGVCVDAQALIIQHSTVTALSTADKENEVVLGSKVRDVGHAIGHITTDGIETTESGRRRDVLLDILDDTMKLIQRLRGLRVEVDVA